MKSSLCSAHQPFVYCPMTPRLRLGQTTQSGHELVSQEKPSGQRCCVTDVSHLTQDWNQEKYNLTFSKQHWGYDSGSCTIWRHGGGEMNLLKLWDLCEEFLSGLSGIQQQSLISHSCLDKRETHFIKWDDSLLLNYTWITHRFFFSLNAPQLLTYGVFKIKKNLNKNVILDFF